MGPLALLFPPAENDDSFMTIKAPKPASLKPIMKRTILLLALLLQPLAADESPSLQDQLRDALYTEEVTRDPATAAKQYEEILKRIDAQRPIAASTLYRLAEIRRAQGDQKSAIALYQQLLRDYSTAKAETNLARQHLADLDAKPSENSSYSPPDDGLRKIQKLATSSPDLLKDPETLKTAVVDDDISVVKYLLEHGADPNGEENYTIVDAVTNGNLSMVNLLLDHGCKPIQDTAAAALTEAIENNYLIILEVLLKRNIYPAAKLVTEKETTHPLSDALVCAVENNNLEAAKLLIEHGADVNGYGWITGAGANDGLPLLVAANKPTSEWVDFLLKHGANPNLASRLHKVTPLHVASVQGNLKTLNALLKHGADPNAEAVFMDDRFYWKDIKTQLDVPFTPLALAADQKHPDCVQSLLKHGAKQASSKTDETSTPPAR